MDEGPKESFKTAWNIAAYPLAGDLLRGNDRMLPVKILTPEMGVCLNVYFGENGIGFPEVAFSIYRVAGISEDGIYYVGG